MIAFEGENQDLGNPEYKKFIMKELLESLPLTEAGMRNLRGTRSQYREVPQTLPGVTIATRPFMMRKSKALFKPSLMPLQETDFSSRVKP